MKKIYITVILVLFIFSSQAQNLKSKYYQDSTLVDSTNKAKGYIPNFSGGGTSNNYVPDVIPPSPNAASMGRFGDIALNLSSGLPNLPIPLYTAIEHNISVPIGLQYRYTGFRPSEDGGVLGRGWSLNAGGIVTRTQKGAWHDEKIIYASGHQGGYLTSGYATAQVIDPLTGLWICTASNCPYPFGQFEDLYDGEPDMFNFSFGNVSGRFFFGADGLIKIVSDQKLKIDYVWKKSTTYLIGMSSQNIIHWTITTEDGAIYRFGFTGDAPMNNPINVDLSYSTVEHTISAWHLYEIEAQTGEKVKFTYLNDHVSSTDILKVHASFSMTQNYVSASDGSQFQESSPTPFLSRSAETFLKTIEGTNWKIDFTHQEYNSFYQAGSVSGYSYIKLLQSIKVSAKTNPITTLKSYDFTYNGTSVKALLTTIQPKDNQGNIAIPAHTFEYFNNTLPSSITAFSTSIDYWNYYNGATNTTLLPQFGANRNPDLASTRTGALKKIIYPTGGTTEFEYELNEFGYIRENAYATYRGTIGGLRVNKMTDTPVIGTPVVKQYQYNDFSNTARSSGVVEEITIPYAFNASIAVNCSNGLYSVCPSNNNVTYTIFKSEPYYQMSREPVYYYNVREIMNNDSRSDHVFTSHLDFQDFLGHAYGLGNNSVGPVSSQDFARGLPKNIKYYKNATELISEKKYSYVVSDRYKAPTFYIGTAFVRDGSGENIVYSKGLNTYSGWLRKVIETDVFYNGTASFTTQNFYDYNTNLQVYKKTSTEGKATPIVFSPSIMFDSRVIETYYSYPPDFSDDATLSAMTARNIISPVIEKLSQLYDKESNQVLAEIDYQITTYTLFGNAYLPSKIRTKVGDATGILQTAIDFLNYDSRGNLLKYKTRSGQTTILTWYSTTDFGKADMLKSHTVGGGSTGTVLSRSRAYDYKPLVGLSIATDLNNYSVSYQYDNFNRLISIKDPQSYLLKDLNYHYANQTALSGLGVTPTNTMNYVLNRTARIEQTGTALDSDVDKTTTQIQYLDGLGKNLQSLIWKGTPDKLKDLVSGTTEYDSKGRAYKSILPTPSDTLTGAYKTNAELLANSFYVDSYPYTETVFESSPQNRPIKQFGVGQAWRTADKYVSMEYRIAGTEVLRFDVNVNEDGADTSKYPASSLYNNYTLSERGFQTLEVKDREGKVIAKFQQLEGSFVYMKTGYCYDNLGRLKYVIPPEIYKQFEAGTITSFMESDSVFKEGIFGYVYDSRGRQYGRHIPGAGWEYSIFDKNDFTVMRFDEKEKAENYVRFTKFDALGRMIVSGIKTISSTTTRSDIQTAFDGMTTETFEETGTALLGYTNRSFPAAYVIADADVKEVLYYDDYSFNSDANYNFQSANAFHTQGLTKGLITGMLIRNVETNDWYKFVNYVDYKGRIIQQHSQNHLGGIDRTDYQYRFNNEVLKMRMTHRKTGAKDLVELYEYAYDHVGRKTSFTHNSQVVAKYEYDGIGRLQNKKFRPVGTSQGSKQTGNWTDTNSWLSGAFPLANDNVTINTGHTLTIPNGQIASAGILNDKGTLRNFGTLNMGKVPTADLYAQTMKWHIRGGLRGINLDGNNDLTNSLFSFKLGYEEDGTYYDGNIRNQYWKSNIDGIKRAYEYSYDGASRITKGNYGSDKVGENYALNAVTYDFNGNITKLSRKGWRSNNTFGLVDSLKYTYNTNSNKILKVDDLSNETASFRDIAGNDYAYSLDGSLTSDANKGITLIEYNYLKLPRKVIQNGVTTLYQYDASGKKLKETIGTNFTDYSGNKIYKNNQLYQIAHDEGRIIAGEYEYNIKDHLGNLRVAFRDSLGIAKITQSYAYGIFGEELPTLNYLKPTWKADNFKFTGKESSQETGFIDFGARWYDNIVPRFISIDPLAELNRRFSPTVYGNANPLRFIDPDGMANANAQPYSDGKHEDPYYREPNNQGQEYKAGGDPPTATNVNTSKSYDKLAIGTNVTSGIYAGTKLDEVVVAGKKINAFDQAISSFGSGSYNRRFYPRNPNDHQDYGPLRSFFALHAFEVKYTTPIGLYFGAGYTSLRGQGKFYLISNPPLMSATMSFNASTSGLSGSYIVGNPLSETTTLYDYGEWSRSISAQYGGYGIGTSEGRTFNNTTGFSKPLNGFRTYSISTGSGTSAGYEYNYTYFPFK
jgi:RHS repeat-associated protein